MTIITLPRSQVRIEDRSEIDRDYAGGLPYFHATWSTYAVQTIANAFLEIDHHSPYGAGGALGRGMGETDATIDLIRRTVDFFDVSIVIED